MLVNSHSIYARKLALDMFATRTRRNSSRRAPRDISSFPRLRGKHIETDACGGYIELRDLTRAQYIAKTGKILLQGFYYLWYLFPARIEYAR